ncbi:Smad nuclear-interacting protein 1 [Vanrija pseudolonga]|uniref:Smad nuclear-interacting protein 1 n=1 Tax=Vanrija pseudolonga TaxID=143232 RepID=A0AAF1BMF9_9TREE|nr:Smad nuclear-interacting protein 1 [Vanrija pseudolonga]
MPRDSPPHQRTRDRSRSPQRRDRERERDYDRKPDVRGDRDRGDRGGERGNGYGGGRPRDEGYGARERERERESDRKRYDEDAEAPPKSPPKPNFGNSGLLAKESNTVKGVALKYHEPPEARKPVQNWRLYVFKGDEQVDLIHIYRQSCYLLGRDAVVTDIPIAHPSCSKQHAVIQFRQTTERNEFGDEKTEIKPYVLDLESTNGTYVNDAEIPKTRYYELRNKDVLKFGTSTREYVLLHEESKK